MIAVANKLLVADTVVADTVVGTQQVANKLLVADKQLVARIRMMNNRMTD